MTDLYVYKNQATYIMRSSSMDPRPKIVQPFDVIDQKSTNLPLVNNPFFSEFNILDHATVTILRSYALGDVIQVIPVIRWLKHRGKIKNVFFQVKSRFYKTVTTVFPDIAVVDDKVGVRVNLDYIFERDHSLSSNERSLHRVDIAFAYLGLPYEKRDLDWSATYMNLNYKNFVEEDSKTIGLQIRGSRENKTLPREFIKKLAFAIVEQGYKVLLLDDEVEYGFHGENIINACGQTSVVDIIENLKRCKCCITMDSGILWLAHVANCPVITFFGPTREQERLSLHPQYPQKAKSINLAEHIGCEVCFETLKFCNGKINCMTDFNYDIIIREVLRNLKKIV